MSAVLAPPVPLGSADAFLQFHRQAVLTMIGREPSAFMREVARVLWDIYVNRMPREGATSAFPALSAATGGGKTLAACALLAYLAETEGATGAYVVETIESVEQARGYLEALMPGRVAAYSALHRDRAPPVKIREYAYRGVTVAARFSEEQFRSTGIVVTTHDRWKRDLTEDKDCGVLRCRGVERSLVVVDEEPDLQVTFQRQPEDVSALASLLADRQLDSEARTFGFTKSHHAADTLRAIHDRMRIVKDYANSALIRATADLVTAEDAAQLATITRQDLAKRLEGIDSMSLDDHWETVQFLLAAAEGRVFYSKDSSSSFHAYAFRLPVKARHIVLDGTADLNGLYAVGSHVTVVEGPTPNYGNLQLFAVTLPKGIGTIHPEGALRNAYAARPLMEWLFAFIEEHTQSGERVLIYGKQRLLDFGLHSLPEFDDSGKGDRSMTTYLGRELHWVNFGRGRGLNKWKDCTVYIRLGDFWMKKAVAIATVGSVTRRKLSERELRYLSSGRSRHAEVRHVMETHVAVSNKQDAARCCIRNLADDGSCPPARAYMVDCDLGLLVKYQARMFPGSAPYRLIGSNGEDSGLVSDEHGAAARFATLLLTTDATMLSPMDVQKATGLLATNFARALSTHVVREAMEARGWQLTTRKAQGLPGKGRLLVRSPS